VRVPTPRAELVGRVLPGDERVAARFPDRALLLVYPPPGDMAARALAAYAGPAVVYVGEGRGGANASDAFLDALEDGARWRLRERVDALAQFPGSYEVMYVFERVVPGGRGSL